jgi:hypothetical protein
MQHVPEQHWADIARGVAAPEVAREAVAHLASGCPDCQATSNLWRSLAGLAANERNYAPPDNLVRLTKLEFTAKREPLTHLAAIGRMIFDSVSNPVPVGVRGTAVSARQVVYEAEGLIVDLRFERQPRSGTIAASGQVLDMQAPHCMIVKATIFLWTDRGHLLNSAEANDFGEFQFEFEPQDRLRISIESAGRRTLRIPLGNVN